MSRKNLIIREVPVPDENHPPAPYQELPRHEFTFGIIAPKGGGKTTLMCNLLRMYAGYFHQIWWISPTILSDDKLGWLKSQKLLARNDRLLEFFKDLENGDPEQDKIVQNKRVDTQLDVVRHSEPEEAFTGIIPSDCFVDEYTDAGFKKIMDANKMIIDLAESYGHSKHIADRIAFIIDDPVGMDVYNSSRKSYFKGVNTRHRHYSASGFMVTQGYKEVPKTIRTNWTCIVIYEIGNMKELYVIYEEFNMGLSWVNWREMYDYCTAEPHSFMFIDFQKPRGQRIMKNFTEYLTVIEEKKDDLNFINILQDDSS